MKEYPKMQSVFKRDMNNDGRMIVGRYSEPEFEYLADNDWVWREKVDGTNIRVGWNGERVEFGGKTERAQIPAHLIAALMDLFRYTDRFQETFTNATDVCLYGEGYGPKIQKGGGNYRDTAGFVLFDVRIHDWWLQRKDIDKIAEKLRLGVVPIIGRGPLSGIVDKCMQGFNSQWGDFRAEGIVATPAVEMRTRSGQRIITKLKCKDFDK